MSDTIKKEAAMTRSATIRNLVGVLAIGLVLLAPAAAHAAMRPEPLVSGGQALINYLINILGPILMILGLIGAAISVLFANREGLGKCITAFGGGAIIFAAPAIVEFMRSIFSR